MNREDRQVKDAKVKDVHEELLRYIGLYKKHLADEAKINDVYQRTLLAYNDAIRLRKPNFEIITLQDEVLRLRDQRRDMRNEGDNLRSDIENLERYLGYTVGDEKQRYPTPVPSRTELFPPEFGFTKRRRTGARSSRKPARKSRKPARSSRKVRSRKVKRTVRKSRKVIRSRKVKRTVRSSRKPARSSRRLNR
jgi:hypothetical protein